MPTWKLTLEYEGTRYSGWQEQQNARTVAGEIRIAAKEVLGSPVEVSGAGRTDAGVHALAQVARLKSAATARPLELLRALNDRLPPDINILKAEEARASFDPRRDAVNRYYLYQIATRRTAFAKRFVWWVKDRLDVGLMSEACQHLAGRHDFAQFCEKPEADKSTIVVVERVEIGMEGDLILFRLGASHFLWKMARRITGALVGVGRGALAVKDFRALIDSGRAGAPSIKFNVAAHTAPPSGLFLERVVYAGDDEPGPLAPAFPVRSA
ncbi:MAG TPA: tRNA pseudouridine(38-40) synthase TruA [Blastocatellia bacterium]|nr:tRNA pseudouridine(38-40) synthase TruA [Blastocatellia bacterium]